MALSNPLSKKRGSAAPAPGQTADGGRRSLADLAKMDLGELVGLLRGSRKSSPPVGRTDTVAPATTTAEDKPAARKRRSVGDLAKMDLGAMLGAARLPHLSSRHGRAGRTGNRPLVGVDIEPGYVSAVQVSVNGTIAVERAAAIEIAPEVVRDGEVVDVGALSEALKALFSQQKFEPRVRLGIANQRIVVRTVELPPIDDPRELDAAVRFRAQDELPMSLDSAVIDYHSLGVVDTPEGLRQRVVLVAARREMVERLLAAAREAGLRPEGIDLSAFALIRSLHVPGAAADERVVYLSLGGLGNLAVAEGSVCQFTRVLSIGLESIAGEVAERLGVSVVDGRSLLMRVGLDEPRSPLDAPAYGPSATEPTVGIVGDRDEPFGYSAVEAVEAVEESAEVGASLSSDPTEDAVRGLLGEGVRRIGVEIRNSLHYHAMNGGDQGVARVVVSGAMTQIPGFVPALASELELEVQLGVVHEARPGAFGGVPGERLAIAAGLAVGEAPS